MAFVQMCLSFIFMPDGRTLFACFLKTVVRRLSYDIHMSVAKLLHCKFNKLRNDRFERQLRDGFANIFWGKKIA